MPYSSLLAIAAVVLLGVYFYLLVSIVEVAMTSGLPSLRP